jgi:PilZ domain
MRLADTNSRGATVSFCAAQVRFQHSRCISGMNENRQVANACPSNRGGNKLQANERRQERTALSVPVQIISYGANKLNGAQGVCVDISEAGVAFVTEADLHLTDIVELVFSPKSQPAFRQYVRLLYRVGPRYGGYFSRMA